MSSVKKLYRVTMFDNKKVKVKLTKWIILKNLES